MKTCLHLLTLFIRLSTLRHALLFRLKTCVEANNYSPSTSCTLKTYIEKERADNIEFLRLFSLPSLEDIYVQQYLTQPNIPNSQHISRKCVFHYKIYKRCWMEKCFLSSHLRIHQSYLEETSRLMGPQEPCKVQQMLIMFESNLNSRLLKNPSIFLH